MNRLILLVFILTISLPIDANALQEPRVLPTDKRLRSFVYDPNEVYKFTGHYKFQSSIEFAADEEVATVSLGDSLAWQVSPAGNRIFLKPIEPDATTNMTVITNKRIYHFELHAEEAEDITDEKLVFAVRFNYPNSGTGGSIRRFSSELEPDIEADGDKFNFNYTISGSELIAPLKIFDDGEFTYFEFRDKNADIPAFFRVNSAGEESVVNYHIAGKYVVVERVTKQFTLRSGPDVTCVFNEALPELKKPREPERKFLGVF